MDDAEELAEEWLHFGRDDLKSAARMLEDPGYHQASHDVEAAR